jgi:parallel beta-helix repeat protein
LKRFASPKSQFTGKLSIIGITVLMIVLFLCIPHVSAQNCRDTPEIFTYYNQPGYYQLDSDINYAGTCILINGSYITLDGMGHTLSGVSTSSCLPYGIMVYNQNGNNHLNNIYISNLTVRDKFYGIDFVNVNSGSISNINALLNNRGISIRDSNNIDIFNNILEENTIAAIGVAFSHNANVKGNSVIRNNVGIAGNNGFQNNISDNILTENEGFGVHLEKEDQTTIANNIFNNNLHGIWLLESNNINVNSNQLNGNTGSNPIDDSASCVGGYDASVNSILNNDIKNCEFGIFFMNSSDYNIITKNTINGTDKSGILIQYSGNNTLLENTITNNLKYGIHLNNANSNELITNNIDHNQWDGMRIEFSELNSIYNNTIASNTQFGIALINSSNSQIWNNFLMDNINRGISLENASQNTIYNNFFNNTKNTRFLGINDQNIWNTTKISGKNIINGTYVGGNVWVNPNGTGFSQTCADSNHDGICDVAYTLGVNNTDYLPLSLNNTSVIIIPPVSSKIGVFRNSTHQFYLDYNGNGVWNGAVVDRQYNFGLSRDIPVTGDWNAGGRNEIGVFRNSTHQFYLDYNGNGVWNGASIDKQYNFGISGDKPISGDWNNNKTTEIGVFRNSTHQFYLDYNGNGVWNGASIDKQYNFGISGDIPISGDWNNNGTTEIGVFRPSTHLFYIDYNGNGVWNGASVDRQYNFGISGDIPVTGDWNADGRTEIGVFRNSTHLFYLDYNGNGAWNGAVTDRQYNFGISGDTPVSGKW